jgi:hypothetical protein
MQTHDPGRGFLPAAEMAKRQASDQYSCQTPLCAPKAGRCAHYLFMDVDDLIKAMGVESDTPIEVGIRQFVECYKKYRWPGDILGKR